MPVPLAWLLGLVLALLLGLAGCSLPWPGEPPSPPLASPAQGQALYQEAAEALLAGDLATARAGFDRLVQSAGDVGLQRRARLGQAATALAAARAPGQAAAALDMWRAWLAEPSPGLTSEDLRLLTPALNGLEACLAAGPTPRARQDYRESQARLEQENQRLKKQLGDLEALHKELLERRNRLGR
ncbi:MAG: hypothetical protein V1806_07790 [Pseudomonadota bacterium]